MRKLAATLAIAALAACDRAPAPTGQWSPGDHDPPEQQQGQAAPQGSVKLSAAQQLVATAWMGTCAQCHGATGRGDGPNGALVKAPDLTNAEWQAKVTDQEIADQIRHGKGLMPPNDLPDSTIQGLVGLVRALKGQ
ncbi:MAG TPA: cytochrome c [Polyangiaceae bacterium]|jgi:cytochrome c oxidase cbb3-type subunit 3